MHATAMSNGKLFFDTYLPTGGPAVVADIGAQDVNGSLKSVCPPSAQYVGLDFVAGKGVDVIMKDPYVLPLESNSVDVIVSSSCFEHSEMFWVLFLEIMRVLKPDGLFYLNVPSNGPFHQYPVDCWRFYPDSGRALVTWAKRNGVPASLLESYTSAQSGDVWNDFVAVFVKDGACADRHPKRIVHGLRRFRNARLLDQEQVLNLRVMPEDAAYSHPIRSLASRLGRWLRNR